MKTTNIYKISKHFIWSCSFMSTKLNSLFFFLSIYMFMEAYFYTVRLLTKEQSKELKSKVNENDKYIYKKEKLNKNAIFQQWQVKLLPFNFSSHILSKIPLTPSLPSSPLSPCPPLPPCTLPLLSLLCLLYLRLPN